MGPLVIAIGVIVASYLREAQRVRFSFSGRLSSQSPKGRAFAGAPGRFDSFIWPVKPHSPKPTRRIPQRHRRVVSRADQRLLTFCRKTPKSTSHQPPKASGEIP